MYVHQAVCKPTHIGVGLGAWLVEGTLIEGARPTWRGNGGGRDSGGDHSAEGPTPLEPCHMHILGHVCNVHVPKFHPQVIILVQQHSLLTGLAQPGGLIPAGGRDVKVRGTS